MNENDCFQVQNFVLKSRGKEVIFQIVYTIYLLKSELTTISQVQPSSDAGVGFLVRHVDDSSYAAANVGDMEIGHDCILNTESKDGIPRQEYPILLTGGASNFSLTIDGSGAGMYTILYANCREGTAASFRLAVTLMNRGGVFLSAGDIPLPAAYGCLGAAFLVAAAAWIAVVRAHRSNAHAIHTLMAVLCIVKVRERVVAGRERK